MNCPLHFHWSSPALPFPLPLLGSKLFQDSAEMFSVKHSQELSRPWGKWSLCVPTKSFPLSQWCCSEDFWFLPSCYSLRLYSSAPVWDFCLLTQLISPLQKKKPSRLPKIFTFLFCTLEFFLYLALFCQRQGILPFSILFLSYISEKLKFLKTFFTLAVTQLCHTSSAFLHLYSFLYLHLCLFFSEISKSTFLRD